MVSLAVASGPTGSEVFILANYEFDWVDAFTDQTFGGNACVVVHGADDVDVDTRTRLVRETSLSECSYLVKSDVADFGARYYLAEREILMAGHPTVATVASLLSRGLIEPECSFTLEVGAGVLPIAVSGGMITMTQAKPEFLTEYAPDAIARIYGLEATDIVGVPQVVSTGTPFCIAVLRDEETLERAVLNVEALQAWRASDPHPSAGLMEPFLVTLREGGTYARLLLPPPMPAEDPFTGAATGCMAAYVWAKGLIEEPHFVAAQGDGLGRPGRADVEVLGPRKAIEGVRVGGRGRVLMSGVLHL